MPHALAALLLLAPLSLPAADFDLARELDRALASAPQAAPAAVRHHPRRAHSSTATAAPAAAASPSAGAAGESWRRLQEGNRRFRLGDAQHPNANEARRFSLATAQKPFAVVLSCSDSRVPPEVIFDQGLGDLFVIRVAGNIAEPAVLASAEYAVAHLGCPLILVLGHERCGAVKAAVGEWQAQSGAGAAHEAHGPHINLRPLLDAIFPAVALSSKAEGDPWDNAVCANARLNARRLAELSPLIAEMKLAGTLSVMAARYDLDEGAVAELPE